MRVKVWNPTASAAQEAETNQLYYWRRFLRASSDTHFLDYAVSMGTFDIK